MCMHKILGTRSRLQPDPSTSALPLTFKIHSFYSIIIENRTVKPITTIGTANEVHPTTTVHPAIVKLRKTKARQTNNVNHMLARRPTTTNTATFSVVVRTLASPLQPMEPFSNASFTCSHEPQRILLYRTVKTCYLLDSIGH